MPTSLPPSPPPHTHTYMPKAWKETIQIDIELDLEYEHEQMIDILVFSTCIDVIVKNAVLIYHGHDYIMVYTQRRETLQLCNCIELQACSCHQLS